MIPILHVRELHNTEFRLTHSSGTTQPTTPQKRPTRTKSMDHELVLLPWALTWKGAISGIMTNGTGPNPMANDLPETSSWEVRF